MESRTRGDQIATGLESIDWYSGLQFISDSHIRAVSSHSKRLKREAFPSRLLSFCNDSCHFVNVKYEFLELVH